MEPIKDDETHTCHAQQWPTPPSDDCNQVAFRDALMHLQTYSTTQADYDLLATHFWDVLTDVIHLLPTHEAVLEPNHCHLANTCQSVICCKAKHNQTDAKKASDDEADGLVKEVLFAVVARVMFTHNL